MKTTWQRTVSAKTYPSLSENIKADVTIIGGGITGVTLAYLLSTSGKKVVVLDKGKILESTTAYTTAFVVADIDTDVSDLVSMFGKVDASMILNSHQHAIESIEKIVKEEKINCEWVRCPEYFFSTSKKGFEKIKEEGNLFREFGFNVRVVDNDELPFNTSGAVAILNQAKFHPLQYVEALREKAERNGVQFYENSEVIELKEGRRMIVNTNNGAVVSDHAVIATYTPFHQPSELFFKKGTYVSYIYELEIPQGILPEGVYEDDHNPYHYWRIDKGDEKDRMIVGGEDHRKEIPIDEEKNFKALQDYLHKTMPNLNYEVITRWSGPILEPSDGLALIGSFKKEFPNLLVATAFSGNGMTYSMIAGQILSDMILGRHNQYASLYDPLRTYTPSRLLVKARDYTGELIHGALRNMFRHVGDKGE